MLSIILLNYNNTALTKDCIREILNQSFNDYELVIVENNSLPDQRNQLLNYVKSLDAQDQRMIKVIQNSVNAGFTGGNNLGYRYTHGDIILFLNNDVFLSEGALRNCYDFLQNNQEIAALGPKILYYTAKDVIWSAGGFFRYYKINLDDNRGNGKPVTSFSRIQFVDFISGAAFFIKRGALEKIGLFDDDYFIYWEETDLCMRLLRNQLKIVYFPRVKVYHNVGLKARYTPFVFTHLIKNRMVSIFKNLKTWKVLAQIFLTLLYAVQVIVVFVRNNSDTIPLQILIAYLRGIKQGLVKRQRHLSAVYL